MILSLADLLKQQQNPWGTAGDPMPAWQAGIDATAKKYGASQQAIEGQSGPMPWGHMVTSEEGATGWKPFTNPNEEFTQSKDYMDMLAGLNPADPRGVMIDGKMNYRMGPDNQLAPRYSGGQSMVKYDPTYGYVYDSYGMNSQLGLSHESFLEKYPIAMIAAMALSGGLAAGAGAAAAGEGAALGGGIGGLSGALGGAGGSLVGGATAGLAGELGAAGVLGGGLGGISGVGGAATGLGGASAAGALGGGMGFFDDILGIDLGIDPSSMNYDFNITPDQLSQWNGGNLGGLDVNGGNLGGLTDVQQWAKGWNGLNPDGSINWDTFAKNDPFGMGSISDGAVVPQTSPWNQLLQKLQQKLTDPQNLMKLLTGNGGGTGGNGGLTNFLNGGNNNSGGGLLSLAPSLAAIAYAKNQDPFDLSKLNSAYDSINPNSLALPYDIQTGHGRNDLTSSLTQRGVMGSSFANQDLSSYDTLRGLGRQNLLTSGATSQASIANQILNAQIGQQKNKNDLYGRALLALSGGLGGAGNGLSNLFA